MCEPMSASTAIGLGISAVGTGMSVASKLAGQGAAQGNRDEAIRVALDQTIPSLNQSLGQVYNSNTARANQESDKAATTNFDVTRQMAAAKGTANATAGDAGVGGVSFANVLSDLEMRAGLNKANVDYNYTTRAQQIDDENHAAQEKTRAQINGIINGTVAATPVPSPMSTWAGIAGDAAGAGLRIGDKLGWFDNKKTKVDPKTGQTYGPEFDL